MSQVRKPISLFLTKSFTVAILCFMSFSLVPATQATGQEWSQWATCGDSAMASKEPVEYRFKSGGGTALVIEYRNKTDFTWEFDNVVSHMGDTGGATIKTVAKNYRQTIGPRETKSVTNNIEASTNLAHLMNMCSDFTRAYWIPLAVKGWQSVDAACGSITSKGDFMTDDLTEASIGASNSNNHTYYNVGECIRVQEKVKSFD